MQALPFFNILIKYRYQILLFLAILFGSFFRLYHLDQQPYWMDEGYTINAVTSIVETGSSVLDSGRSYNCPVYCYPTAYIVDTFGEWPTSYRILASLAGILLILLIYYFCNILFNRNIALLSSFFIAFSYFHVAWSREARWYTLLTLFFWLAAFSFYLGLKQKNYTYLLTSFVATILAILTHPLAYLLPIIFILWTIYSYKTNIRQNLGKIFFICTLLGIVTLLFDYLLGINFFYNNLTNLKFTYTLPYYLLYYLVNYFFFILLTIYYFYSEEKNVEYRKFANYLLLILFVYLIPIGTLTAVLHYRYLFHLTPILFIIPSLVIVHQIQIQKNNFNKYLSLSAVIIIFFAGNYGVYKHHDFYFLESDWSIAQYLNRQYAAYTPQPNWNAAYEIIKNQKQPDEIIISSHPHLNKIFLKESGYWIKYPYLGINDIPEQTTNDREYYVNALVIDDLIELKEITQKKDGYIVFDYMSQDIGRIPPETIEYIRNNFTEIYANEINPYSKIWVYRFKSNLQPNSIDKNQ